MRENGERTEGGRSNGRLCIVVFSRPPSCSPLSALVLKVGVFDVFAEGQQVGVPLDPLGQLAAGQLRGQDGEEMAEHQGIQLCGAETHAHTSFYLYFFCKNQTQKKNYFNYFYFSAPKTKILRNAPFSRELLVIQVDETTTLWLVVCFP